MSILNNFVKGRYYNKDFQGIGNDSFSRIFPSSEDIYSPENPTFGFFFRKAEHLKQFEQILLRDGALGIIDFFFRFPKWMDGFPVILVSYDLAFLVPKDWQLNVKLYELKDDRETRIDNEIKNIVFYSILNESFNSWPLLKNELNLFLKNNFKPSLNVSMYSILKENIYQQNWFEDSSGLELTSEIQFFFKNKIKFINKKELKQNINSKETLFVNLDLYKNVIGLCSLEIDLFKTKGNLHPRNNSKVNGNYFIKNVKLHLNSSLNIYSYHSQNNDFEAQNHT